MKKLFAGIWKITNGWKNIASGEYNKYYEKYVQNIKVMNVSDCRLIDLPKFLDKRGNLSFAEEFKHIPFKIERTYWIYDVPGGEKRGACI